MEDVRSQQSGENPDRCLLLLSGIISVEAQILQILQPVTDSSVPALNDAVPEERYCTLQSIIVPNHLPDDHSNILKRWAVVCDMQISHTSYKHQSTARHILTDLGIERYHEILLHAGSLCNLVFKNNYWIMIARMSSDIIESIKMLPNKASH
ncbi:hypothetical protein TNCT_673891 [Trichonephila clavata]|uniref:Uncharacterized protein n=1 Tax=Trichonephila clavata TaxID=2740835 RepID=A0A8X6F9R6_TRICU|nr:hypothetical protein TNCT_673891 [Trichonephila clavata]